MTAKFTIDTDALRRLSALLDEANLSEIEYEARGQRIRVRRDTSPAPAPVIKTEMVTPTPDSPPGTPDHPGAVSAPMVGTVYMAPAPEADPYVREGDDVEEGQTLMLLEAMKTMNPVTAPRGGKLVRILVANGAPVEYGETLALIE